MVNKIKNISVLSAFLLCVLLLPLHTQENAERGETVVDMAGALTATEQDSLQAELERFSAKAKTDAAVVIVEHTGDKTPEAYADDYFDYNGYGYGENDEGVLLLIVTGDGSPGSRYAHITTHGNKTISTITDRRIDDLLDALIDGGLKNSDYMNGIAAYTEELSGLYFNTLTTRELLIAGIAGLLFFLFGYKTIGSSYKLRTVPPFYNASENTAVNFASTEDMLISTNTTTVKRQKQSSSGRGGSSTHTSSSGRRHGGGGRSF